MSDTAIRVRDLGKQFHIGALRTQRYRTLRDQIASGIAGPFRRATKLLRGQATGAAELDEIIWALRDVSFDVERGEVIGIIGHNGAGKSTLLKILSRITEPTTGFAEIRGRVGSLLEVGTGFHPELTGRENVFLNGAILGMTRAEITAKFDEIVAFSEVERFIDTPVKHYSTGMSLRLAFAVAAHLEPEILVVDEVLAVGDAEFQRKCLGKMGDVAQQGRTIVLVSHNMAAITDLCGRAMLLNSGRVTAEGEPTDVVAQYLAAGGTSSSSWSLPETERADDAADVIFESVRVLSNDGAPTGFVGALDPFSVELTYTVHRSVRGVEVFVGVMKEGTTLVFLTMDTDSTEWSGRIREEGRYISKCHVPGGLLGPGDYVINIGCHVPGIRFIRGHRSVVSFGVSDAGYWLRRRRQGAITPRIEWEVDVAPHQQLAPAVE